MDGIDRQKFNKNNFTARHNLSLVVRQLCAKPYSLLRRVHLLTMITTTIAM